MLQLVGDALLVGDCQAGPVLKTTVGECPALPSQSPSVYVPAKVQCSAWHPGDSLRAQAHRVPLLKHHFIFTCTAGPTAVVVYSTFVGQVKDQTECLASLGADQIVRKVSPFNQ